MALVKAVAHPRGRLVETHPAASLIHIGFWPCLRTNTGVVCRPGALFGSHCF
jgi:hypothetical protein